MGGVKDACELARALRLLSLGAGEQPSRERDNEAASLIYKVMLCDNPGSRLAGRGPGTGGPAKRVPVDGEAFRTMSLYLEGTSKAALSVTICVS